MQKIRECPYCGSNNVRIYQRIIEGNQIICQDCMMRGPSSYKDAIEKWNAFPRKSDNERVEKEFGWLVDIIGKVDVCPSNYNLYGEFCGDADTCKECWREAARRAMEEK